MAKWMISAKRAEFDKIARECGISTVLSRLIRNRGIIGTEETLRFLSCDASLCHDPYLLPEMAGAVDLIREHLSKGSRFRIVGDYDVDGICSARILLLGLHALGGKADAILPERITDGYGINERLVDDAARDGVDIIITCDNGISAAEALERAAGYGMTVVVTDHHEPPSAAGEDGKLKQVRVHADAVVDPKLETDDKVSYPFRDICGAVVAYKLAEALFKGQEPMGQPVYNEMLSLCALATVCDVMPLTDENRYYVRRGLELLSATENPGMRSLIMECGLSGEKLSAYHAGFIIGPCLNASGRMDTAARALSLLNETDTEKAILTAKDLRDLNESR
ncbi:MAG: DHH family phosphoesterase, partial [Lachnospiraceae bacterium]|nr:DHH family phosphoesterase [Lachnospiraceae bacterium]